MKTKIMLLCSLVVAGSAIARRADTPTVPPVTHNGVIYSAPHAGSRGGVIEAHDTATKVEIWSKRIYGVEYASDLEEDCQWIYVKTLSLTNDQLVIVNEANHAFTLDLKTRDVTALSKDMVVFETLEEPSGIILKGAVSVSEQVEMTCKLLRFDRREIEVLARKGQLDSDHIVQLWQTGKSSLLAMPTMIVQSGKEAIIKSVSEMTYPTELAMPDGDSEHSTAKVPVPSNFEMREVGVIFLCNIEVRPAGDLIFSLVNVIYIEEPVWKTYSSEFPSPAGRPVKIRLEQPFFPVYSFQNQIEIPNGKTVLIGGGLPTADKKGFVFALLTGKIVRNDEPSGGEERR